MFHVVRTDVDPEDDVPVLSPPSDGNLDSQSWTTKFEGEKLYRVWGEMWRTDWIDPASASPIVRGEKVSPTVAFIIDAQGNRALADMLVDSGRWLWFKPTVISALINRRGGSLTWYTKETGGVAAFPGQKVHFGLNSIGLVNVYAKDVAFLPEWQQRVWAAHNVGPDGKLSEELQASQVYADPARTQAPEAFLEKGLNALQASGKEKLGISILRKHAFVAELLPRIHRFRANDREGLFALAKDVARITADDIDEKVLQAIVGPPKGERWASLKSLEKVLAQKVEADQARRMLSALAGIYDLRLADAHLPSNKAQHAIQSIGIDETLPYVKQGFQLLDAAVGTIYWIAKTIERMW